MSAGRVTPPRLALFLAVALLAAAPPSAFAQLRSRHRLSVAMAGPAGVTANWVSNGVKIDWQAVPEAVQYNVLRGPDGTTVGTQIGAVRGDVFTFTDVGFAGTAGYQVIAVAADGRQGASAIVLYTPPATLSTTKLTTTTLSTTLSTTMLRTATSFSDPAAPPVIAAFGGTGAPDLFAKVGETVTIAGTGLDGLTSVKLVDAYKPLTTWVVNTAGGSYPVSPANVTPTSFSFVVGQLTTSMSQYRPFLLIVTKATGTDTSNGAIQVVYPQPTRKITGVAGTYIRGGTRVKITGVGLNEVIGGYFGSGTPGSQTNPLLNMWNRTDTYVELETVPTCQMSGLLMLHVPVTGGTPQYVTADTNITVYCFSGTPTGEIDGRDAQGMFYANANSTISIRGTNLRAVTNAVDNAGNKYPVTYAAAGTSEWVTFKLGSYFSAGLARSFQLENRLIDPIVNGTVTGTVIMVAAPTFYRLSPAWAEPGQKVTINGHNLTNGATPTVTVGGVPAQVLSSEPLVITFRVPATATAGPVAVTNPGGTGTLGAFTTGLGTQHPGFFVVSGPSSASAVVLPGSTPAFGDTITVQGQNLARLGGICVPNKPESGGGITQLRRADSNIGYAVSNTEMKVVLQQQASYLQPGAIQLLEPTGTVGDFVRTNFACAANTGAAVWP